MRLPHFVSQRRAARLGTGACFLFLSFLFCFPASAQLHKPGSAPTPAQPEVPTDALGRATPRGAVLGFLGAAAALAHQLFIVLDRRLPPRLNQVSDDPEGSLSDPLKPDQELVGTISGNNGNVDILVERIDGKSGSVWLFS